MIDQFAALIIFWGVWLLVPILVDGLTTLYTLIGVSIILIRRRMKPVRKLDHFPFVSIIIPVYNSSGTLEACLRSIAAQDYPLECIEILLVNNGSRDRSHKIFSQLQSELNLQIGWLSTLNKSKAWALNAGIHIANGIYIFNVDSDVVLAPDAIREVVQAMEFESNLGAVTGTIEVLPPDEDASRFVHLLEECEFFEYLTAFHVGREHQTLMQNIYTLSGAFSVFRRELLLQTSLYSSDTVTEDTDLTFEIYERFPGWRIACVSSAVAYVHPVESLSALYAQRIRWQRGQIEVSARHERLMQGPIWRLRGFSPARILLIDHTLAFPRIVWTFLLPILTLFGYSLSMIIMALIVLYTFYLLIDLAWVGVAWLGANQIARKRLQNFLWILPMMPLYRMVIFWFRIGGFLHAVAEPGAWKVQDPIAQIRAGLGNLGEIVDGYLGRYPAGRTNRRQ
jgi:biofilm PGA synthesis N-glycosyltransferase PgaC